ncbi:MAG: methylated-DNA--[protein]-cysteine S-methyltransferase [Propionibacteriales bacterium]|nr:methylated-DNA--[protein]-cysteine S-methyltransferase [Propionibacteriales bacterium]
MNRTHSIVDSPIGPLTVVCEDGALVFLHMDQAKYPPKDFGARVDLGRSPLHAATQEQLGEYFAGERTTFDLPVAPRGEGFHQTVWTLLQRIAYGERRSYGQLAEELGDKRLAQAVGWANGRNPIAIVIPCHRVLGADGSLTGYAGGLDRKRFLLELEEPAAVSAGRLF